MTEDHLNEIPRRDASQIMADIPAGPGYEQRVLLQLEGEMNLSWWRGYYAAKHAYQTNT